MTREKFEHVPIPTYEEATASGSGSHIPGDHEADIEREGLLGNRSTQGRARNNGNYQAPTAESVRSSQESDLTELVSDGAEDEEQALRRDMEQMEEGESSDDTRARERAARRQGFTKRFSDTLTSLHLPRFSSFNFLNFHLPQLSDQYKPGWGILARLFGIFLIMALVYTLVVMKVFNPSGGQTMGGGQRFMPSAIRSFVQGTINKGNIEAYLLQVTFDDHVAGTVGDFFLANYIEQHFKSAGFDNVYLDK